jgi:hypothetical protein
MQAWEVIGDEISKRVDDASRIALSVSNNMLILEAATAQPDGCGLDAGFDMEVITDAERDDASRNISLDLAVCGSHKRRIGALLRTSTTSVTFTRETVRLQLPRNESVLTSLCSLRPLFFLVVDRHARVVAISEPHHATVVEMMAPPPSGDMLFCVGGRESRKYHSFEETFVPTGGCDRSQGGWKLTAQMQYSRNNYALVQVDNAVYAVGGRCVDGLTVDVVDRYDVATNEWASLGAKTPLLEENSIKHAVVFRGEVHAFSSPDWSVHKLAWGDDSGRTKATQAWVRVDMREPRPKSNNLWFVVHDCILYVLCVTREEEAPVWRLARYKEAEDSWVSVTLVPPMLRAYNQAACLLDGALYFSGGRAPCGVGSVHPLKQLLKYTLATNVWTILRPMTTPRMSHTITAVNGVLYAVGGYCQDTEHPTSACEVYYPATDTWAPSEGGSVVRAQHGGICVNRHAAGIHNRTR